MKIGLVGLPGCGKSTVFGALTGMAVETGYGSSSDKANIGVVKVPDSRVDELARLYEPKKTTYAEVTFRDLAGGRDGALDRTVLNSMREVDALCQVLRAFPDDAGDAGDPLRELLELEIETILADLQLIEGRADRLRRDRSDANELALLERVISTLEAEQPLRGMTLSDDERRSLSGYALLTLKPLLLALNVSEDALTEAAPAELASAAEERQLGLVVLSASVEMDIAQMEPEEQSEFVSELGLEAPARDRFIRAAFALIDLISMLTAGPDECRAWPIARGTAAPRAAGKIHSDIERGFIRAEVIDWADLVRLGSEAKCRDAGVARVEGKDYIMQDGDVVNFRFNV